MYKKVIIKDSMMILVVVCAFKSVNIQHEMPYLNPYALHWIHECCMFWQVMHDQT